MSKRIGCTLILFDCQQSLKAANKGIIFGAFRGLSITLENLQFSLLNLSCFS